MRTVHIAEGCLPPLHAAAWTVATAPFVVHGARAVVRQVRENPLHEPPSDEVASGLLALPAALGAGLVGYYFGVARTRRRLGGGSRTRRDAGTITDDAA